MDLKHYVPTSIGVFLAVIAIARYFAIPVAPFALVLLVGETIIGLQLEDQKVYRFLADITKGVKSEHKSR